MLSVESARDHVEQIVERARKAGADAADALCIGEQSSGVQVRMGELEDVSRSEGVKIGLRVFVGQRSASVASSDLSVAAMDELVARAVAMAAEAPEDEHAGLAPADLIDRGPFADLDSWDPTEPDPVELKAQALEAEAAALAVPGVSNSSGCGASSSASSVALATSNGFSGAYRSTGHGCSASVIAGDGPTMQRDYSWHSARHRADLEDAAAIGRRAGDRAAARVGGVKVAPGAYPILFEPRVATSLLGHYVAAVTGAAIARKTSFLLDALGERIFAAGVDIYDDPLRPRGLRSRAFDSEGLAVRPMKLVDDGVVMTWLAESASARQLGIAPTGHAVRGIGGAPSAGPSNLYLSAGNRSLAEMLESVPKAIVVTELIGQGVNAVTGDYSRGAAGFLYEQGERVGPVSEITIASNLKDMFAQLEPADDLEFRRGVDSPTVLIPEMVVASA